MNAYIYLERKRRKHLKKKIKFDVYKITKHYVRIINVP